MLFGGTYKDHDLVCARPDGTPMSPQSLSSGFRRAARTKRVAEKLGKRLEASFHDLRHTHATMLLLAGQQSVKVVSARLGHQSAQTTQDIYAHVIQRYNREAAERFQKILSDGKSGRARAGMVEEIS